MVTNVEFLGEEPLDNIITCINFKIDKVIFFGYHETIEALKESAEKFLKRYCGVRIVTFFSVSKNNLQSTLNIMRKEIEHERSQRNQVFFDITGGESLILVAYGMLSKEFETPMHMFDVLSDKIIELNEGAKASISKDVEVKKIRLFLDMLIQTHGGKINGNLRKRIKHNNNREFMDDVERIFKVARGNWDYWHPFSLFLRTILVPVEPNLQVSKSAKYVLFSLQQSTTKLRTFRHNHVANYRYGLPIRQLHLV